VPPNGARIVYSSDMPVKGSAGYFDDFERYFDSSQESRRRVADH
jgi:hypothetical protein